MPDMYSSENLAILRGESPAGNSIKYHCFPLLAGAGAAGIALTVAGGPAWSAAYGAAWTTIANAGGADITTEFWVCGLYAYTLTGAANVEIQMSGAAAPADINDVYAELQVDFIAVTLNVGLLKVGPYPVWQPAAQLVAARIGGGAAKTLNVHVYYAIGL